MHKVLFILSLVVLNPLVFGQEGTPPFSREEVDAARKSPRAFMVDPESVRIMRVGSSEETPDPGPPVPFPPLDPGTIINIGKEIWKIIEANKPVVDIRQSYATALPDGTAHWSQLSGWRPSEGTTYEFTYKNLLGMTVVNVRFQVLRTWGGGLDGVGKYLTSVTTEPLLVEVAWGYRFSMDASVPKESVTNVGTRENPVAAMIHNLKWRSQTVLEDRQGTHVFHLQGDGQFRQVGGPFEQGLMP